MKTFIPFTILFILFVLPSCNYQDNTPDNTDFNMILRRCKGHAIVSRVGFSERTDDYYPYSIVIKDDSLNAYVLYTRWNYNVKAGDTLK